MNNGILLTGANGFVGRYLCSLLNEYYNIFGIYRNSCRQIASLEKVTCIQADLGKDNLEAIYKLISKSEIRTIVHLAANINVNEKSDNIVQENLMSLNATLLLAKKLNVEHFIYFSSIGVYGTKHKGSINIESPTNCESFYHLSKLKGEQLLYSFCSEQRNIIPLVFRLSSPVGIGMRDSLFLPTVIKSAMANKKIVLYGKGQRVQNYIDVRDIVNILKSSIRSRLSGTHNLVSPKSYSNKEVAEICKNILSSRSQIVYKGNDIHDEESWVFDCERIKEISFDYDLSDSVLWIAKHYENSGI